MLSICHKADTIMAEAISKQGEIGASRSVPSFFRLCNSIGVLFVKVTHLAYAMVSRTRISEQN